MAKTLNKIGITTGNTVEAYHVTQSVDAFTAIDNYDISLSGSFNMTGSINGEPTVINPLTASYAMTASYALNALSASYAVSASHEIIKEVSSSHADFADTASYVETAQTASYVETAQTASFVNLTAGPNITINQSGTTFEISGSGGGGGITPSDTGSFYISSSIDTPTSTTINSANTIIFNQGDSTTESVTVNSFTYDFYEAQDYTFPTISTLTTMKGDQRFTLNDGANNSRFFLPEVVDTIGSIIEIYNTAGTGFQRIVTNTNSIITFGDGNTTSIANGAYIQLSSPGGSHVDEDNYIRLMAVTGSLLGIGTYISEWVVTDYWDDTLRTTTDPATDTLISRITFGT